MAGITQPEAESRLIQLINDNFSTVPIAWPNIVFTKPSSGLFGKLFFVGSPTVIAREVSQGGATQEQSSAIVQFFCPLESGRQAASWASELKELLRDHVSDDRNFCIRVPSITHVGDDGNGYYQVNLTIPFYFWSGN